MADSENLQINDSDNKDNAAEVEITPVDSVVMVEVENGGYSARIRVLPPENGGAEITIDKMVEALNSAGVVYGIGRTTLSFIEMTKKYDEWITVANCKMPENGENGSVEYLFSKEATADLKEDAKGFVDYKNLGIVKNITAGTVIANITKETPGTPGINVRNEPIAPKPGNPPKITFAENIAVSEDGLTLVSTADGNLVFSSGRFSVQTIFKLDGDVDVATGNIDFIGEVQIRGDVREGFSVTAGKGITISGGVFGAVLKANEKIVIRSGAIGSNISSGGTVEIDFAENTIINCKELLKTKSLIFCDVYCDGEVNVTSGNGSIFGGKVVSTKNLHANNIGSRNYIATVIVIGDNAIKLGERDELVKKMAQIEAEQEKCSQIVEFLKQKREQLGQLPQDKTDIMNSALKTILISRNEKDKIVKRIEEIDMYLQIKQNLYLNCKKELNPGVKIIINDMVFIANVQYQHCQIGLGNDGIEVRTL